MSVFDIASTAKAIHDTQEQAFATVPDGRTNVLLIDATYSQQTGGAARVLWARKVGDGWNIVSEAAIDKPHGLSGRVATMKSW